MLLGRATLGLRLMKIGADCPRPASPQRSATTRPVSREEMAGKVSPGSPLSLHCRLVSSAADGLPPSLSGFREPRSAFHPPFIHLCTEIGRAYPRKCTATCFRSRYCLSLVHSCGTVVICFAVDSESRMDDLVSFPRYAGTDQDSKGAIAPTPTAAQWQEGRRNGEWYSFYMHLAPM